MAKQSGIHQLRGKVGEHSYYRQTGIQSGLVRSINQGMSSRVKTDEAFANTRLNNHEFGQAGRLAAVLSRYISPKFRPMVLPFSQSKMAKILLEYIKQDSTHPWGRRNLTPSNARDAQIAALNLVAKNRFDEFGFEVSIDENTDVLNVGVTEETLNKLSAIGADGVIVRFIAATTWIGEYTNVTRDYAPSGPMANTYSDTLEGSAVGDELVFKYTIPAAPPTGAPAFGAERTGVLIVLPFRTINGGSHILQENCSFKAFAIVDGTVA